MASHHYLQKVLTDGSLGVYPHQQVPIVLLPGLEPVHYQFYPVPCAHEQTFKEELQEMANIGILDKYGTSKHALPSLLLPKKMAKSDKSLIYTLSTKRLNTKNT